MPQAIATTLQVLCAQDHGFSSEQLNVDCVASLASHPLFTYPFPGPLSFSRLHLPVFKILSALFSSFPGSIQEHQECSILLHKGLAYTIDLWEL